MFCWPENKPLNMFFKLESQTCSFNRFPSGRLKLKWNYVWFMIYGSTASLDLLCGPKIHLQFFFAVNNWPFQCVCVCIYLLQISAFLCHSHNKHNSLSLTNRKEEKRTSPGILWIYDPDFPQKHMRKSINS